jgi:type II secretory pathway pseudopilin PulG
MSCASGISGRFHRRPGGLTLVELLVAIAIVMAFLGSTVLAFIQIMRASDLAQARMDALSNARHAAELMTIEFKRARPGPPASTPPNRFVGMTASLETGNGKDDDNDGKVDEESVNGLDDDGDWTIGDDRHAAVSGTVRERKRFVGTADLGDGRVDEDARFARAKVRFRTFDSTTGTREVRFYVGEFDGTTNVLLREVTIDAGGPEQKTATFPVAFNVLSFSLLFWDQNSTTTQAKYWRTDWNSEDYPPAGPLPALPASVAIGLTVYAGTRPLALQPPGEPLDTVTVSSMVDIESVLDDPRYATLRETYP